jgi:hypothetical protein
VADFEGELFLMLRRNQNNSGEKESHRLRQIGVYFLMYGKNEK